MHEGDASENWVEIVDDDDENDYTQAELFDRFDQLITRYYPAGSRARVFHYLRGLGPKDRKGMSYNTFKARVRGMIRLAMLIPDAADTQLGDNDLKGIIFQCLRKHEQKEVLRAFRGDITGHTLQEMTQVVQATELTNNLIDDEDSEKHNEDSDNDSNQSRDDDEQDDEPVSKKPRYPNGVCRHRDHLQTRYKHQWAECQYNPNSQNYCGFKSKAELLASQHDNRNNNRNSHNDRHDYNNDRNNDRKSHNGNRSGYGGPTHQGSYMHAPPPPYHYPPSQDYHQAYAYQPPHSYGYRPPHSYGYDTPQSAQEPKGA
jgi:hypothetical protein